MPEGQPLEQIQQLRNEKAVLEDLLKLRDKTVTEQSGKLKQAVNELEARARELECSETNLRDQTIILQSILNSMSDGVVVADKDGKFLLFNPAAERIIGIGFTKASSEEWPQKYGCYFPDGETLYPAQDLPLVRAIQGESVDNLEILIRNDKRPQGVWISVNARPLRDKAGIITGGVAVLRDISEERNTKEAFDRSEAKLQSILDNATSVIYVKDLKGNYLLLNRQFEKLFKTTREKAKAKTDYDLFPKEMADAFRKNDEKVLAAGEAVEFEEIAQHDDGPHTYISIKFPLFDRHNTVYAVCGISTDIAARKKAEETTRASLDYLDKIINAVADPIFVKDRQYRCVLINDAYCHFIGHPREMLINKSASDFFPKKEADIFHEKDEMVFRTGQENINEEEFTDAQGVIHTIVTKKTLYVDNRGDQYIVGIISDITDRKRAEKIREAQYIITKALAESGTLREATPRVLRAVSESLDWDIGAIWRVDAATETLRCVETWSSPVISARRFQDITRKGSFPGGQGLPGRVWESGHAVWIPDITHDSNFPRKEAALSEGLHTAVAFPIRLQNEVTGVVEFFHREIRIPDIELLRMFEAIGSQIGQFIYRKQAEETLLQKTIELAKTNAEREQLELFTYVASHDLQEPLQKVIAFGGLLKTHAAQMLDDKGKEFVDRMQLAASRMSKMIEDLVQFSKVVARTEPFEAVDLEMIVGEVLSDLDMKISQSGARVEVEALPLIDADKRQMHLLFQNLISNALKFQKKGQVPVVKISSRALNGEQVEIFVEDNGIGFDEDYLEKIFRPFERMHSRSEFDGNGIGLAICHKIVLRHHGTITAKSKQEKGSIFIISLPYRQRQESE